MNIKRTAPSKDVKKTAPKSAAKKRDTSQAAKKAAAKKQDTSQAAKKAAAAKAGAKKPASKKKSGKMPSKPLKSFKGKSGGGTNYAGGSKTFNESTGRHEKKDGTPMKRKNERMAKKGMSRRTQKK